MRRRATIKAILGLTICGLIFLGTWILERSIRINCEERERCFVAVHFIAMGAAREPDDEAPKTIQELMKRHGWGPSSALLKPFSHGLIYQAAEGGFELAEPSKEFVSLFRRDRLIASDSAWPHWESSGRMAWKFPGQKIPPGYLRTKDEEAGLSDKRKPTE